ncbi:MAG TPA: hypothetical protein VGM83_20130 [Devosiaceae bacterium]|jgi:hypothetical protein
MEAIVAIIVQLIGGGVGGNVIGQLAKSVNLGPTGNTIAGAVGGLILSYLATKIPGLDALVGAAGSAAPASADAGAAAATGGLNVGALAGQGVAGLVGGGVLTAIAGLIKNQMAK